MTIKEIFEKSENGTLTFEQFESLASEGKAKFTDLSEGNYISTVKYNDELKRKDSTIEELNETISTRDNDLETLKTQLKEAGTDSSKLETLSKDLTTLQTKYDTEVKQYKTKLSEQAYHFAVKDFARTKKFSSKAAQRDFEQSMIAENLKMKGDSILGAEDFVTAYTKENADAFIVEEPKPEVPETPKPQFVSTTPGQAEVIPDATNAFANAFNFTGVRPQPKNNNE